VAEGLLQAVGDGADAGTEDGEDAADLVAFLEADVGEVIAEGDGGGGFDEDSPAAVGVIVDDAWEGALLIPADGDDEAAIAEGNEGILEGLGDGGVFEQSFEAALEGLFELDGALAEAAELGAGGVEEGAILIEAAVEVGAELGAGVDVGGEGAECGPVAAGFALEEGGGLGGGIEEGADEEEVGAVEEGAFGSDAAQGLVGVGEAESGEAGSGIEQGQHIGVERDAGLARFRLGGGADGLDGLATEGGLGVAADGLEEGPELEDIEGVLVHQCKGR